MHGKDDGEIHRRNVLRRIHLAAESAERLDLQEGGDGYSRRSSRPGERWAASQPGTRAAALTAATAPSAIATRDQGAMTGSSNMRTARRDRTPGGPSGGEAQGEAGDQPDDGHDGGLPGEHRLHLAAGEPQGLGHREVAAPSPCGRTQRWATEPTPSARRRRPAARVAAHPLEVSHLPLLLGTVDLSEPLPQPGFGGLTIGRGRPTDEEALVAGPHLESVGEGIGGDERGRPGAGEDPDDAHLEGRSASGHRDLVADVTGGARKRPDVDRHLAGALRGPAVEQTGRHRTDERPERTAGHRAVAVGEGGFEDPEPGQPGDLVIGRQPWLLAVGDGVPAGLQEHLAVPARSPELRLRHRVVEAGAEHERGNDPGNCGGGGHQCRAGRHLFAAARADGELQAQRQRWRAPKVGGGRRRPRRPTP